MDIKEIKKLEEKDYLPSGCTALIDALGETIDKIKNIHRYIREEDIPCKTLFIITTDGMENASTKYAKKEVKDMIETQKEKGWEFIYLAANIDATNTAKEYGIAPEDCADYINDEKGNEIKFECMSKAISTIRKNKTLNKEWNEEIKKDFKLRNK